MTSQIEQFTQIFQAQAVYFEQALMPELVQVKSRGDKTYHKDFQVTDDTQRIMVDALVKLYQLPMYLPYHTGIDHTSPDEVGYDFDLTKLKV